MQATISKITITPAQIAEDGAIKLRNDCGGAAMTFEIYDQIGKRFIPVPDAKEVKIKGWEDFTFFLHRPIWMGGFAKDGWVISEAGTGCQVGTQKTRSLALEYVTQVLSMYNTPENRQTIREKAEKLRRGLHESSVLR